MTYSREAPSPRYLELQEQYRLMHLAEVSREHEPTGQYFPGWGLLPHIERIYNLIRATGSESLLDYGSGKGNQYSEKVVNPGQGELITIPQYWGIGNIHCYDPAYEPFSRIPGERFDAVISTDMVEHCPEQDLPWILDEMFSHAGKFVYINAANYPAKKTLLNGENAHCTIKPSEWWLALVAETSARHPGIQWEGCVISRVETALGLRSMRTIFSSSDNRMV